MRFGLFAALILVATAADATGAFAEKRVALVIGNAAYQNVAKLPNPINDARAVAALLKNAGFDVVEHRDDLGIANMRRAMRDFTNIARDADIGVVYYAGHGIEVDGTNYLIPVDAVLQQDVDVEDETLSLDRVLRTLDQITRLRLVILDACRDNPFTRTMKRTIASRAVGRGLAKVEPTTSDTLIAFAAKAGSTALDGDIKNSPFTTALLRHLTTPGLDLRLAFGQIRDDVLKATSNRQEPFVYGSLGGSAVALVPAPEPKVPAPLPAAKDSIGDARRDYYEFLNSGATKEAWNDFLQVHPTGPYANLARSQLAKLIDAEKRAADEAKTAEKAAIEKAAAQRATDEKRAAAEKVEAEKAAKKAEADRLATEKAAVEKAMAEKDATSKAPSATQSLEAVVQEKAKVKVATVGSDTPPQTAKPTVPGPPKRNNTTQDRAPPTRTKIATRSVEEEQPTSRARESNVLVRPGDTCARHLSMCRSSPGISTSLKIKIRRARGTCQQRYDACLRSGRYTDWRGRIHAVARR